MQNEAGYRQIIASKERVIVGLLNEKEENKIAYEQLRKQNELLKARLQALQAQGSSSSSSSGLPLLPPAAQDVKGDELATLHKKLKALEEMVEDAIVCPVCHEVCILYGYLFVLIALWCPSRLRFLVS